MIPRPSRNLLIASSLAFAGLLGLPATSPAEDIDIFSINPSVSSLRPNVLIILDNSANWSSTDSVGGGSKYQNVRSALSNSINGLSDQFNVGLMLFGETGGANDGVDGGVVRAGIRQMTTTNKDKYKAFFDSVDGNFDKTNNTAMGLAFAEAYYYFTGKPSVSGKGKNKREYLNHALGTTGNQGDDNPTLAQSNAIWALPQVTFGSPSRVIAPSLTSSSSTTYNSPIIDPCQKNFIVFIANGTVSDNTGNNSDATTRLATAGGDTSTIVFTQNDGLQDNITDEWARFLANNDLLPDETNFPGKQTITSYTIEVNPIVTGQGPNSTELMKSIAHQGKGKYFGVSSASSGAELTDALNKIFAEVLALNSVFASSTLPVSVNVRGTFLNQVYMGVFRPEANSSPRWAGNVKQYTLKATADGDLFLADKVGVPVENSTSGFVSPSAQSFWTFKDVTTTFWDNTYYPDAVAEPPLPATTADLPDGFFVEKGGAAEHLRQDHLTDLTTRKLFTCIGCAADTHLNTGAANQFADSNTSITTAMLGITAAQSISSLTRSSATATATFAAAHGFTNGQVVTIEGASETEYNGNYVVTTTGPSATSLTYTLVPTPVTPATTSTSIVAAPASGAGLVKDITSITRSATTVTVLITGGHAFTDGQTITITGSGIASYDGSHVIANATANQLAGTFTFTAAETPVTPATNVTNATAVVGSTSKNINNVTRSSTTVTVVTTNPHGFANSDSVTIAGVTPSEYNGTFTITNNNANGSNKQFTFSLPSSSIGPATPVTTVGMKADPALTKTVTSLTRGTSTCSGGVCTATASASTSTAHGFTTGDTITISGADQAGYNKTTTVTVTGSTTFTYTVTVAPNSPATGTISAISAGSLTKTLLVNWVRGENRQLNDNPTVAATRVRGYLHGDVLHSRPAVVNYNRSGQPTDRDVVVYYGSNDGIVHAVKGGQDNTDGGEKWGFVPTEFYNRFARMYSENPIVSSANPRTYFADGSLSIDAVYINDRIEGAGANAQLYVGMRRGGRFYYSLDVTDPDDPLYKWKIDNSTAGFAELGQSWSEMKVVKLNVKYPVSASAASRKVVIFGGGYDSPANDPATQGTATMGRAIYVVDALTGALIWYTAPAADATAPSAATFLATASMSFAAAADLAVIDSDGNGFADRIYAVDTGGNIWRVNIGDANPANWTVGKVASLSGAAAADKRRFLFAPDIVPFNASTDSILVGSGDREQPFDTTINNRFYMVKDSHAIDAQPSSAATESDLCDLTANNLQGADATLAEADRTCIANAAKKGWLIKLGTGEKVVTSSSTLGGTTTFATNTPVSQVSGQCVGSLGKALLYAVNYKDATSTIDFNSNGVLGQSERSTEKPGGGFPPSPVPVSIKIDDKYYEAVITGTQVINPPTSSIGHRYRVFWNMAVDN